MRPAAIEGMVRRCYLCMLRAAKRKARLLLALSPDEGNSGDTGARRK